MSQASDAAVSEAKGAFASFEFRGETFTPVRKPSLLLLAEMADMDESDPQALGILVQFFKQTLGDGYAAFRKVAFESEDEGEITGAVQSVVEVTLGRPTE